MWIYILIAVIVIIALVAWHDTHNFVVREYEVNTDKIKGDMTFVLLADLHGYVYGNDNDKLISAIDEAKPDLILCAGDMFTARKIKGRIHTEAGEHVLKELASRYPVCAANGNHEKKIKTGSQEFGNLYERYRESLKRAGVVYLENGSATFDPAELQDASVNSEKTAGAGSIRIYGLELERDYFRKCVKRQLDPAHLTELLCEIKGTDRDTFNILIAHNPQYFKEYAAWGADLTVSGHVHGGIARLPLLGGVISPAIVLFPKYDGGKFEENGKTMILSRGLGTHTIHFRFLNPAEVSVIKIKGV